MSSTARKQAPRLARPAARYWKGKAPKGVVDADSDSDEEEAGSVQDEDGDVDIGGDQDIIPEDDDDDVRPVPVVQKPAKTMNVALRDVNISKDGKVIVAGREESGRTAMEDEEDGRSIARSVFSGAVLLCLNLESEEDSEDEAKPRPPGAPKAESDEVRRLDASLNFF